MHVVHVINTPELIGGAERVLGQLVDRAVACGFQVTVLNVFTSASPNIALRDLVGPERYCELPYLGPRHFPILARRLRRLLSDLKPDLLHAHLPRAAAAVIGTRTIQINPTLRHTPTLLTHHHGDYFRQTGRRNQERLDQAVCQRFDRVVACSEMVRSFLIAEYHFNPGRVTTIRNGWSGQPLPHVGREGKPTIVCVANFRAQKNHRLLVAAFAKVKAALPGARLVLIGSGPLKGEIVALVHRSGLQASVRFAGAVQDIWPELARADLFALMSAYEPLGIVVLEAMAAGLPVVALAVGGIPELVTSGVEGTLVTDGDATTVAHAMVGILTNGEMRSAMAAAGRRKAAAFPAETMADSYLRVYGEMATG